MILYGRFENKIRIHGTKAFETQQTIKGEMKYSNSKVFFKDDIICCIASSNRVDHLFLSSVVVACDYEGIFEKELFDDCQSVRRSWGTTMI